MDNETTDNLIQQVLNDTEQSSYGPQELLLILQELKEFRDIAATYTPNGTPSELQKCLEECQELTVPDGWGSWDDDRIADLMNDSYAKNDYIECSSVYEDMEEEKDMEIDELREQVKTLKLAVKDYIPTAMALERWSCPKCPKRDIYGLLVVNEVDACNCDKYGSLTYKR